MVPLLKSCHTSIVSIPYSEENFNLSPAAALWWRTKCAMILKKSSLLPHYGDLVTEPAAGFGVY